jgi:hypothetical protein
MFNLLKADILRMFPLQQLYFSFMHLRHNEKLIRIYHHHPLPFFLSVLKISFLSAPFYFLLFLFRGGMSTGTFIIAGFVITAFFLLALFYLTMIYWADRLIVTNYRVIHINWHFLTVRREYEAELQDIQDIETQEKGILSFLKFLDYGLFEIQTAASRVSIIFRDAPDPEAVKAFIFRVKDSAPDCSDIGVI